MDRRFDRRGVPRFDALVALVIVIVCVKANVHFLAPHHLMAMQVQLPDAIFAIAFIFVWHYCFAQLNLYDTFATVPSRMTATLKGVLLMTTPVTVYLATAHHIRPSVHLVASIVGSLFLYEVIREASGFYVLDRFAARDPRRAIILGSGPRASKAWRSVRTRYHRSILLLGFVDNRGLDEMAPEVASRYLGTVDELNELLLKEVVDLILISMPIQSCYPIMQQAIHVAESVGVQINYLQDIYSSKRLNTDPNRSIFRELAPQQESYLMRLFVKRMTDVCGALIGILLLSPVLLAVALAVKLSSPGPVLFKQQRYGRRRRLFTMCKFRTMVHNAEELLPQIEHLNEATGPIFKIRHDPRVTKVGAFLRRTSLDELPQLFNVLMGDMSLVGPRPMSIRDVSLFSDAVLMRRFSVMPGMTGLWQVSGRSDVGFDQWIALDSRYIDKWSLALDLKILFRTLSVIFRRSGAM